MKKYKGLIIMLIISLCLFGMVGCNSENKESEAPQKAEYEQISAQQAKEIMDSETGYVIVDARTQEEFDAGHIEGAILIPEYEIAQRAEKELPDKE